MAILPVGFAVEAGGYQIERSLRFNTPDAAYLNRTFSTPTAGTKWTYSLWMKKCGIAGTGTNIPYLLCTAGSGAQGAIGFGWNQPDDISFVYGGFGRRYTPAVFRDPSAWYHLVFSIDTTQGTEANRAIFYVNGVQQTWTTITSITQNDTTQINQAVQHNIGRQTGQPYDSFNGYLTEIYFIDGQALTPSSFGETDTDTGVWKPKAYSGSYGTNGFYLDFGDNSSTTALGYDAAGSNDWTPNNFSVTAGAGNDSLVDSPTRYGTDTGVGGEVRGNYATWNAAAQYSGSFLTNGNLDFANSSGTHRSAIGTIGVSSGKWYWEMSNVTDGNCGISSDASTTSSFLGNTAQGYGFVYDGQRYNNGSSSSGYVTYSNTDVIGFALDMDAGTLTLYKNGASPVTGVTGLTGTWFPATGRTGQTSSSFNAGQRPFAYTAPSGFKALCTTNLPEPTIAEGRDYMNVKLWTGNGSTQSITGVGFQPDLVWTKDRGAAFDHTLFDAVRGATKFLRSNDTTAEETRTDSLTSFDSDGFSVGADSVRNNINKSSASYVSWAWKANGAGVSNTAGTISSTVSANTTAGFSVVTYTGTGSAGTIGHGLGVKPSFIIFKVRSNGTYGWYCYHSSLNATNHLVLNTTAGSSSSSFLFNDTEPTSTVMSVGTSAGTNQSGETYVAYAFAPVAGYSAFGSYTGNGSSDGPFVFTGFRPRFVMVKRTDSTGSWAVMDSSRSTYNQVAAMLYPNSSSAEAGSTDYFDFTANGFKIRNSFADPSNASGGTYIYAAFAENPTKFALAR